MTYSSRTGGTAVVPLSAVCTQPLLDPIHTVRWMSYITMMITTQLRP